jgi:hypothetical protein
MRYQRAIADRSPTDALRRKPRRIASGELAQRSPGDLLDERDPLRAPIGWFGGVALCIGPEHRHRRQSQSLMPPANVLKLASAI